MSVAVDRKLEALRIVCRQATVEVVDLGRKADVMSLLRVVDAIHQMKRTHHIALQATCRDLRSAGTGFRQTFAVMRHQIDVAVGPHTTLADAKRIAWTVATRDPRILQLIEAASLNDIRMVRELLEQGVWVNVHVNEGMTPLRAAAAEGAVECAQILIDAGTDTDLSWALVDAAAKGHRAAVRCLLAAGANVDSRDASGHTALMAAAHMGHVKIVRQLLWAGASVNLRFPYGGTALTVMAERGRLEMAELLVAEGANVNATNADGETALDLVRPGHTELRKFLVKAGAKTTTGLLGQLGCI
jgi:phosphoribosylanthranilate isomerase